MWQYIHRYLTASAGILALSVLADSGIEHYRGGYYNRFMYLAPAVAAATVTAAAREYSNPAAASARPLAFGAAIATGLAGLCFHLYNVARRTGGWKWVNLFYGAPLGAPMALHIAGLLGLASRSFARALPRKTWRALGHGGGTIVGVGSAFALAGTAAEAGFLHFRGAFHDPCMYLPVTIPPLASVALIAAIARPSAFAKGIARFLLRTTAIVGLIGVAFHAYGISRNMGGWKNWTQNLQNAPPLPAPPSFAGIALAGLAALNLMEEQHAVSDAVPRL